MKFLYFLLFACASLFSIVKVNGANWPNPGRKLRCWPEVLKFSRFDMQVHFSTRRKKDVVLKSMDDFKTGKTDFDPRRRTAVIIHGMNGEFHAERMSAIKDAFLDWQDMNVIIYHWESGSWNTLLYHYAAVNTEYAALELSSFLSRLAQYFKKQKNIDRSEWGPLHIIGYSMGAHVAGQTGGFLRRDYNWLVSRITGLDPAEPCFEDADNPLRLNNTQARFVDIIHSDGARFRNGAYGILEPMGHADFYVNGGSVQPGCPQFIKTNFPKENPNPAYPNYLQLIAHTLLDLTCSHERSVLLFIESIKQANSETCKFWGRRWRLGRVVERLPIAAQNKCKGNNCPQLGANKKIYNYDTLRAGRAGVTRTKMQIILQRNCNNSTCPQLGIHAEDYNYPTRTRNTFYVVTSDKKPFCNVA